MYSSARKFVTEKGEHDTVVTAIVITFTMFM